jgi:hypothetical protein
MKSLSPLAQSTLYIAKLVLARPIVRAILIAYVFVLHLLVGSTLLQFSHWQECRHDHDVKFWRESIESGGMEAQELEGVKKLIDKQINDKHSAVISNSGKAIPKAENALLLTSTS